LKVPDTAAPAVVPIYTDEPIRERRLTTEYEGSAR
jgi:hypothetical protein